MTGAAIDREIQAALAVDPSPEFLARVRTRIRGRAAEGHHVAAVEAGLPPQ
jgi:hypothetical protein